MMEILVVNPYYEECVKDLPVEQWKDLETCNPTKCSSLCTLGEIITFRQLEETPYRGKVDLYGFKDDV